MKKALLFGTTALLAASLSSAAIAQEDPIKIGVGGYMQQYFTAQNNDSDRVNYFEQWADSEVFFTGKTTVMGENTVGVNIQLEGNTTGDTIDESFLFVEGKWGRFLIGSENSAAYLMHYAAPNVTAVAVNSGDQGQHILGTSAFRNTLGATYIEPAGRMGCTDGSGDGEIQAESECATAADNDGQKITYFTPRYEGFQLGVSFLPDIDTTGGDQNTIDPAGGYANNTHDYGATVGLNYVRDFESFNVAVAGGYYYAKVKDDIQGLEVGDEQDDFHAVTGGLNIGSQGVTVGGSVAYVITDDNPTQGLAYDAGIAYEQDRWGVSVTYFGNALEEDILERQAVQGSVRYRLGTGVNLVGFVGWADTNSGAEVFESNDNDNSGIYGGAGFEVTF